MTAATLDIARITGTRPPAGTPRVRRSPPSDVTLDRIRFTARALPVIVKASVELAVADDAPNLGQVVATAIAGAVAAEVMRVALRGRAPHPSPRGSGIRPG